MNRARRGTELFVDKADFQQFIDLLHETAALFNVHVAAFCLMPTHYYLMVQTPDASLSRCMRHLNGVIRVLECQNQPSMLGRQEFISWVKDRFFKAKMDKEIPASKELAPDMDTIISEVSRYYGARRATLKAVRRGIENEPRDVAIYLIRSLRSEPLMRIGPVFGLNRYSSIGSVVLHVKTKRQKDRKFKERLAHIESNILKNQT